MSLRILFADDSMTAQNMGKKILSDAGYEVVAVSNGAAAVKKIAEQKPDIIILDVYMPGYSGLEVCEKIRASIETLKTPVLLTVGKMEPYKPEDASRVRADGVIIKPFEASDLLAIVKKLEERIVPKAPPMAEQTIMLDRPPDFSQFEQDTFHVNQEPHPEDVGRVAPSYVSVPDEMASSAAFGDLLGIDLHEEPAATATEVLPAPPQSAPAQPEVPRIEVPMSTEFSVTPAAVAPPEQPVEPQPVAAAPVRPAEPEPVKAPAPEPVAAVPSFEVAAAAHEKTVSVPPPAPVAVEVPVVENVLVPEPPAPVLITHEPAREVRHIEIPPDPAFDVPLSAAAIEVPNATELELETTAQPVVDNQIPSVDPQLLSEAAALNEFPTRFGVDRPEEVPVGIASDVPELNEPVEPQAVAEAEPVPVAVPPAPEKTEAAPEDDFEARVARALSVYEQQLEAEPESPAPAPELHTAPSEDPEPQVTAPIMAAPEPRPQPVPFMHAPVPPAPPVSPVPSAVEPAPVMKAVPSAFAPSPVVVPPAPEVVPSAPVPPAPADVTPASSLAPPAPEVVPPAVLEIAPEPEPVAIRPTAEEIIEKAAATLEAEIPANATGGASNEMVAEVVQRVMEKIKPELISEIVKELGKK